MDNPAAYTHFWGLSQKPFDFGPDFDSLFLVKSQKEAIISITQGISERHGLILICGESGIGKTTLLHYLQAKLPRKVKTVFIPRVSIFFRQILRQITHELRLPLADETPAFLLSQLRAHLAEGLGRRENLAIFVDDAQNLNKETFEELRLLSQMQEGGARLVQIILAGEPELENTLSAEALRSLSQQIRIRLRLQPLLQEESRLFIEQRLQRAGRSSGEIFTPQALDLIVSQGRGIFRKIIFLCDQSFQKGFELHKRIIDAAILWKILAEMDVPYQEEPVQAQEVTNREALVHHLFQNPPRIIKPGILAEVLSNLKRRPSYLFAIGTVVLGLVLYLGWEFLSAPSPSGIHRIETPVPVAKEQKMIPAPQGKVEAPAQNAPIALLDKKAEIVPPDRDREKSPPAPAKPKAQVKVEEKPPVKTPPKLPPKVEPKKEPKSELKPEVKMEVRFNEPAEVPKGKTLYSFARDYYHHVNPTLIDYILEANPHIKDMGRIPTDQKIEIPEISEGSLLSQSPDGSWKIRLGTFENPQAESAFKEEPLLREKEIEIVQRQVSPKTTWYRLYAGKFATMDEAFTTAQELRKKGLIPALKK
jgi:general secretion pathway protein A